MSNNGRISTELAESLKGTAFIAACEQCGRCSAACPLTGKDGYNIRRIIRHLQLDFVEDMADSPYPWSCAACARCEQACPNDMGILAAIRALRRISPDERVPEGPACVLACPAHIDIPGYVRLIAQGRIDDSYALIREKVPFPGILGRVCTRPCESACKRGEVNAPAAICHLKRYVADNKSAVLEKALRVGPGTGRKVAVVGSGPAGLTTAYYLRRKGHQVTIFEARSEPGGMMRYGIPSYRLPQEVLDEEINQILDLGIELKTGQRLGVDFDLNQLKSEGYDAAFLAVGAQLSRKIELEGSDLEGVLWGLDFLTGVREGRQIPIRDVVLVIGGGNVAVDVALTALRLGAKQVTMACLESREEMPANRWEIEQAIAEGVRLMPSWGPARVLGADGKVSGMELVRCTSVFDANRVFRPTFDDSVRQTVETAQVILAIGQMSDLSFVDAVGSLEVTRGVVVANSDTQETSVAGVYAGGDVTRMPGSIIEAIAAGRRAASSIDKFLGGNGNIDDVFAERISPDGYTGARESGFADLARVEIPELPLDERCGSFAEVHLGYDAEQAGCEANRCLQCDFELAIAKAARAAAGV